MKVLVTGGGGFVGSYIVDRLLMRGYAVSSLGRSSQPELEAKGVEVLCCDLADSNAVENACEGVDAVFHVAAKAGVWGNWKSYFIPNLLGTRNLLRACQLHKVERFVYTSTPSVVFNRRSICGADESMPYGQRWLCHYAQTKALAEQEVLAAKIQGLKTIALRPHLIWGPGDPHLLPRVIESACAGRLKIVGSGANRVDLSHVENVAEAHLCAFDALEKGKAIGKAYFISDGAPVELWPWVNEVLCRLGHAPLTQKMPAAIAYGLGGLCEALWKLLAWKGEPPMTRFVALELSKEHYFDISAAGRDLAYVPKLDIEAGLTGTIEDLKVRGYVGGGAIPSTSSI